MSGYLQRLFDRAAGAAAPAAALVSPAGPSHSPIAMADQRLNDPAMLAAIGPRGDDAFAADPGEPASAVPSVAPQEAGLPPPIQSPRPSRAKLERQARTPDARANRPEQPPPPVATDPAIAERSPVDQVASPVPPIGAVLPDDFVPPDPPAAAQAPTPPKAEMDRTEPPVARQAPPSPAPALTPGHDRLVEPAPPLETIEPASPPPVVSANETPGIAPPPVSPAPAPASAPEPILMMPPPPPPVVPSDPPPAPIVSERETQREIRTERLRERVDLIAQKTPPRPARPMTAAEASLIGPLVPRPRARTFMGVRRR